MFCRITKLLNDWIRNFDSDECLQNVKFLVKGWPPDRSLSVEERTFAHVASELSFSNDLLFRQEKFVPPKGIRDVIIALAHEGHPGTTAAINKIKQTYWWLGIDN